MGIAVGVNRISPAQRRDLELAKGDASPEMWQGFFRRIMTAEPIASGAEELHPDWIRLFERFKPRLRRWLPRSLFDQIEQTLTLADSFDSEIDSQIASVDPESGKISFLLGAGASKPAPSGIPTVKELLPDLLTRARRLDRDEVTKVADFCDTSGIDNIEDLLTAAQLSEFCTRNPAIFKLVEFLIFREETPRDYPQGVRFSFPRRGQVDVSSVAFLQDTLQVLFGLLSSRMLPADPNPAHEAIVTYLRRHPASPLVTTNYDCCIDRALTKNRLPFSYLIDFANPKDAPGSGGESTPLLKLHGSLNWFYCETCQNVHWIDIEQTVRDYGEDRALYPVVGVCRTCGGQRRGLLVPPLAMKLDVARPLNPLIDRAGDGFEKSDLIIVVGFSFADADLYISRMISKAMQASEATRLLVFDPDPSVAKKVRRKLSVRIPHFDAARVLAVRGDCAEMLPQFFEGTFRQPGTPAEATGAISSEAKEAHAVRPTTG